MGELDSKPDLTCGGLPASEAGVSLLTAEADIGLIDRPMLSPHLKAFPIDGETVTLASETGTAALYGRLYADLIPLLDGSRSRREISAALIPTWSPVSVACALYGLAAKGHAVSGDFRMDHDAAALWCLFGATPRRVEDVLAEALVSVRGDGRADRLAGALRTMGAKVADVGRPDLLITVTDDYLDNEHAAFNRKCLESETPWMLARIGGSEPLLGPVFRPGSGPCWACLEHRIRGNREVGEFLRRRFGGPVLPTAVAPALTDAAIGMAAMEALKWLVLGDRAPAHGHVLSFDARSFGAGRHRVVRRPQCPACGSPELRDPGREPAAVMLRPGPAPIRTSGGLRTVPPETTLHRHRRLVDPVSGVVTDMRRVVDDEDPWLHVHWSGSGLMLGGDNFLLLQGSMRNRNSSGKGSTAVQAEASALCEAVERHSGVFHGDEVRRPASFGDFAEGDAVHPNDVMLYSDAQYARAAETNMRRERFNHVPARFDHRAELDWSPAWSLTAGRHRWLPTALLYLAAPPRNGTIHCIPDTNGCAAGNTLEEAVLQGLLELVERDAFACWWYNRVRLPEVDLDAFGDPWLSGARNYYAAYRREMWVLDATGDLGIPAFVGVSRRTDKKSQDIIYAAGAHVDPHIAALRAVSELNQLLAAVRDAGPDGPYVYDDPACVRWWSEADLADHPHLVPEQGSGMRVPNHTPLPETAGLLDHVEYCRARVEHMGMEVLVLDQTRPDIGVPTARTIVPGLRPFRVRNAPGRLYDVPVAMGWRSTPIREEDLNPVPVLF